jgi:hypothetical protein
MAVALCTPFCDGEFSPAVVIMVAERMAAAVAAAIRVAVM